MQGAAGKPVTLNNGLRFDLRLQAKETRTIDFTVAGSSRLYPAAERDRLAAVNFEQLAVRAESQWDRPLQSAMKLTTPEPATERHLQAFASVDQYVQGAEHELDSAH